MKRLKYLLGFLVLIVVVIFAVSNDHATHVNYWKNRPVPLLGYTNPSPDEISPEPSKIPATARPIPVYLLVAGIFILGFLFSWLFSFADSRFMRRELKHLRRELTVKEEELGRLRNLPDLPPDEPAVQLITDSPTRTEKKMSTKSLNTDEIQSADDIPPEDDILQT